MQKRLVSQNIIQCKNQIKPSFQSFASFIAFPADRAIVIKTTNKSIKESEINLQKDKNVKNYFFYLLQSILYFVLEYNQRIIEIYLVQLTSAELKTKQYHRIIQAGGSVPTKNGVAYVSNENILKLVNLKEKTQTTICKAHHNSQIIQSECQSLYILSSHQHQPPSNIKILQIFNKTERGFQQSPLHIDYIQNPIAIYRDQFLFNNNKTNKQIEIFNILHSKLIGKFTYEGQLLSAFLKENILLIITNKQNLDKYTFYGLNNQINEKNQSLVNYQSVYQKGRSECFQAFLCSDKHSQAIASGKVNDYIHDISNKMDPANLTLLLYIQNSKKNSIEICKVAISKINQQNFKQDQVNLIIHSKTQKKPKGFSHDKIHQDHQVESERIRVATSVSHHKKSEKSMQQMQKRLIQQLVDMKIRGLNEKFSDLENRLIRIEKQIQSIYSKIEKSIENINREQIHKNVENMFTRVTPQFQSYFKEIFKQISGVLDQGMTYYSQKLAKQSQIHRQAFSHLINMTFDAAQEIAKISKEELNHSQKTSQYLEKLLSIKKRWEEQALKGLKFANLPVETKCDVSLYQTSESPEKKEKGSPQILKKKN